MKPLACLAMFLLAVVAITEVYGAAPITENSLQGVWKEKNGDDIYVFGANHEFEYRFNFGAEKTKTLQTGAWEFAPELCWVEKQKGNLMIHLNSMRCCHIAYFLGANLVLNAVAPPAWTNVCSDRVLVRNTTPKTNK